MDKFNDKRLETIKNSIDSMNKIQHIEILKILKSNKNVKINENNNGVCINLSFLPTETIDKLQEYVYIKNQEKNLEITKVRTRELTS